MCIIMCMKKNFPLCKITRILGLRRMLILQLSPGQ
ncbi:hypothetical protein EVA_18568 [gut metagenome]|uniref:Uncharacterized protein n=1 Tax=gut metagenome TaxID=749906 RepID=J9FEI4_9ZZZZ